MIRALNLHKSFGKQQVLRGVSLDIAPGKTTAIVGPSGVGKSVFIKLIMGILAPDLGEIFIGEECISNLVSESDKNRVRQKLGMLFQSAALFDSLTIYDNIAFPLAHRTKFSRNEIKQRVEEMIDALSMEKIAGLYPQEVSIGARKRAGLARALITKPEIVLFDEPNTGLDPLVGQEVYDLIATCKAKWGFTGIVISHELPEVFQVSDRVAMLFNGDIIFYGTPDEMTASTDPYVQQFLHGRTDGPIKIQ